MYFASMKQLHSISIMSEDAVNMGGLRFEVGWGTSKERCEGTCLKTVSDLRLNKSDFVTQKHLSKSPPSRIFVPPTRYVIADSDKFAYITLVHLTESVGGIIDAFIAIYHMQQIFGEIIRVGEELFFLLGRLQIE